MRLTKCFLMTVTLILKGGAVVASEPQPAICFDMSVEAENLKQFMQSREATSAQPELSDMAKKKSLSPFSNLILDTDTGIGEILEPSKDDRDLERAMLDDMVRLLQGIQSDMQKYGLSRIPEYKRNWSRNYRIAYDNQQKDMASEKK